MTENGSSLMLPVAYLVPPPNTGVESCISEFPDEALLHVHGEAKRCDPNALPPSAGGMSLLQQSPAAAGDKMAEQQRTVCLCLQEFPSVSLLWI